VAAIRQDPRLRDLDSEVQRLQASHAPAYEIKSAKGEARNHFANLKKTRLKQYQLEWVRQRRDWKVATRGKEECDDNPRTELHEILSTAMPERGRLARVMISDEIISEAARKQAVEDLCSLASQDSTTFYRPGEKPIDAACPSEGCGAHVGRLES